MNTDKLMELQRWTMKKGSDGAQWSVYMDHDEQGEWVKWTHVRQAVLVSEISGAAALRAEQAVGTARQSEGVVLVPREPTEAMFAAALPLHQRMGQFKLTMIWNAMLAAAPGGEGEVGRG